jgi:hypothetical protein
MLRPYPLSGGDSIVVRMGFSLCANGGILQHGWERLPVLFN